MGHQRELFRIALERTGELRRGHVSAVCEVIDLTEKGIQLKTLLPVEIGDTLQVAFELTPQRTIHCTVLVTRVSPPSVGACISDISPDDQKHLSHFIEDLIGLNLGSF
ncbi:MAG TPA: PilZ domain-containing protein [Nitrospira sp.]|nr:PilZ domain-containing protein [Nitrospira sp.]